MPKRSSYAGQQGVAAAVAAMTAQPATSVSQYDTAIGPQLFPEGATFANLTQAQQDALLDAQRTRRSWASYQAIQDYINPAQTHTGYGFAQDTNHALEGGTSVTSLSQKAQKMIAGLDSIMGPIGVATTLYRGDHDTVLQRLGLGHVTSTGSHLTDAQLQSLLVGQTWQCKGYVSTSHTQGASPFLPGGAASGGREVAMRIHTAPTAQMAFVQKSQAEVLLARGTHFKITGARYTGGLAHPKAGGVKRVVALDVEVW